MTAAVKISSLGCLCAHLVENRVTAKHSELYTCVHPTTSQLVFLFLFFLMVFKTMMFLPLLLMFDIINIVFKDVGSLDSIFVTYFNI